ncbi:MAG: tRNA uridine-5-carboxymethylaminomethyl(34) synthesis enzyme MnmG [Caldisericia bacterium]|nr:tRNA uridine-5-carboxymethylaminomethyl(34) synthesis enzyme MnmG [Caldisericia bacterium]
MLKQYDVIVVGAGHAGCEAALAAARMGCSTLLLTINIDTVAWMPCNPAIGGSGKSQIIAEVDALGGEIALNAERSLSQIRVLNTSRGLALRSKRVQCDKVAYSKNMKFVLEKEPNLHLYQTIVNELLIDHDKCIGVLDIYNEKIYGKTVILTTGTHLGGKIHVGWISYDAGRGGELKGGVLSENLKKIGLDVRRFNTGTTPRIDKKTIQYELLQEQPGEEIPISLSFITPRKVWSPQLSSYLGWTNEKTIEVTKKYLQYSPSKSGNMIKTGPKSCPSIEEKVQWFPNNYRHSLFFEQEGFHTDEVYIAGLNMSIYPHCQLEILRTIKGLENVRLFRPAYAIAYDWVHTSEITTSLETIRYKNLYLAGQINGSTGYDEASAQGIVAGINAALSVQNKEPMLLERNDSYIGVMLDDMIHKPLNEPYRITPSHVEYRMLNREDNADQRMTPLGRKIGLVTDKRWSIFEEKMMALEKGRQFLVTNKIAPNKTMVSFLKENSLPEITQSYSYFELLKRTDWDEKMMSMLSDTFSSLPADVKEELMIESKYEGYLVREKNERKQMEKYENHALPSDIDYSEFEMLSKTCIAALNEYKPTKIKDLHSLPGVKPSDMMILISLLKKKKLIL